MYKEVIKNTYAFCITSLIKKSGEYISNRFMLYKVAVNVLFVHCNKGCNSRNLGNIYFERGIRLWDKN